MRLALALAFMPALATAQHAHTNAPVLTQGGQAAFSAMAEIVARLDADPATEWSRVDLPALAAHLADMDRMFTGTTIFQTATEAGADFAVTGPPDVVASARRMLTAHAATLPDGWTWKVSAAAGAVTVAVGAPQPDAPRLRAIGLLGLLANGDHHRAHHWVIATGGDPH